MLFYLLIVTVLNMASDNEGGDHVDGDNNEDANQESLLALLNKVSEHSDKYININIEKEKERLDTEYGKGGPSAEGTSGVRVDGNDINDGEDEFVDQGPELSDSADEGERVTGNNDRVVGGTKMIFMEM